jgi:multidrug efflux pump subunit AcrB
MATEPEAGAPRDEASYPAADTADRGGIIGVFARHGTAPNLLMISLIILGMFSLTRLNRQFFPDFEVPIITVVVNWPGASAEDVEKNILDVLEPELRFIDNIEKTTSYAREGVATILLEFKPSADLQKARSDVEQAVGRVTTLPEDAEQPLIKRAALRDRIARISVTGPFSEAVLQSYAKKIRNGLLAAGLDSVTLSGARDEEIWVKIREADLRRLGLSLSDVATRIRENTKDQPAGTLEGKAELQLRSDSDRRTPEEIGKIEILSLASGEKILLKNIADIETRYDREDQIGLIKGQRAIELVVERSLTSDTLKTMAVMERYIAEARRQLPPTLKVAVYDVRGKYVQQRLNILLVNGLQGLSLVLLALFIFLNARVAFWTAAGIPVAMFATLALMLVTGQSINMVSMFGLIMMLGIIVDDAIVVGEHAATLEDEGMPRHLAAEAGARRMFAPVTAATLTTAAAFMPIFFIGDRMGDIMRGIPLVVLAALFASLIECFLILPGHLRHRSRRDKGPSRVRAAIDRGFGWFRDRLFAPFVRLTYRWRYTTVAVMIASLILATAMMVGGRVKFVFFPRLEAETVVASIYFAPGVPKTDQIAAITKIEMGLLAAEKQLLASLKRKVRKDDDQRVETKLVLATFSLLGQAGRAKGDNLGEITAELAPSEARRTRTNTILAAWRKSLPKIAGVERVAIYGRRGGPPGRDVDVRLQNRPIEVLKKAAEELKVRLTSIPGTSAIEDDLPYGKQELVFKLTPRGTALGFTGQSVGRQVRNAFEGAIATRFARGDDEITVRVRRTQEVGGVAALYNVYLRTPLGARVPLHEVVEISERQNFAIVQRWEGERTVAVTADLDLDQTTTEEVVAKLEESIMPQLAAKYGLTYRYSGRDEERGKAFKDLKSGAIMALALIYIILGWVFASYFKPLAVMSIIPFGFVGAVFGHYVMGYNITLPSLIGLLGLSGILVNDSIVLVSRLTERLEAGDDLETASVGAARDRLRAVLLTSLTTIGGLMPLMFETSLQAQFLIPLAITIVFGLAAATTLVLILVPSLIGIGGDLRVIAGAIRWLYAPPDGPSRPRRSHTAAE